MAFAEGYVDVSSRLRMALDKYPDLRVTELDHRLEEHGDKVVMVCRVEVRRSADDPHPTIASASEPIPGKTPYTRDSELMVGMTSALGRALGYMGFGIDKSIASANEVENRSDAPKTPSERRSGPTGTEPPTEPQLRMLKALGSTARPATKREASQLIDELRAGAQEEPF